MNSDESPVDRLRARGLLAEPWSGDPAAVGLEPAPVDYADRYAGTLLGGACGDSLGQAVETWSPDRIMATYGVLSDLQPYRGRPGMPVGLITDDTQLTECLAASIVACDAFDPADAARQFVDWLEYGRGKGRATTEAVLRLREGVPWWEAGTPSAGNGAAMRAAPIGLLHPLDPDGVRRDGALSAVVTHADAMAAASAVAQAFAVAYLLHCTPTELDLDHFLGAVESVMDGVPDPGLPERRRGAGPDPVRLVDRLREAVEMRDLPPGEAFARLHNGAFVLESLPAAWYCLAASPDDPERVIVTAVNGGYDADTVAAMAGNLAGALHGAGALPRRWLGDLESRDELADLARGLLRLSGLDAYR